LHWTYRKFEPDDDLEQGDVLTCTDDLTRILAEVHPHFCDAKYLGFVVSTQSCDLVRRPECKARYINISVVRSLRTTLPRLLEQACQPVANGVFKKSARADARRFLERTLNQNEQASGLFYLHPDTESGIGEPAVVLLRVSVSLRAQHYGALLTARRGRLEPQFQAKYGWLLGNLFSRAASPDWGDADGGSAQMERLIAELLDADGSASGPWWLEDELVAAGLANGVQFTDRDLVQLKAELEQHRPVPPIEILSAEVLKVIQRTLSVPISSDDERRLKGRLENNGALSKLVRK